MGCCGQRRDQSSTPIAAPAPASARPAWPAPGGLPGGRGGGVMLRYRELGRVLVRGPVTGQPYELSAEQPRAVDARDAEVLLRTRRFVRA